MIDKDTLASIAKMNNLKPWQQEKHYVQTVALNALSEYPLVFKGGTYLWFFYGLDRFSEDLDFTASGDLPPDLGEKISESMRMFGIENKVKKIEGEERGVSFRISAKGPLNTSEIDVCHVYIEISKREKMLEETTSFELNFDAYKLPIKIIRGAGLAEIVAEKVRATLTRKKARDLYDLYFLIKNKGAKFDLRMVNEKLKYYKITFSQESWENRIKERRGSWEPEMKPLIFGKLPDYNAVAKELIGWAKKQ